MSAPRVILAHPSGNQFFRHLAATLRDAGLLAELCTGVDWRGGWRDRMLPRGVAAELGRRNFSRELGVPVATHPVREMARLAAGRLGFGALTQHETGVFSVDAVYRDFDRWVAGRIAQHSGGGVAYAYEDAAEATFAAAAQRGWTRAYDLPIAYWETSRRLLAEEAARWPEWEPTLGGTRDSEAKLARKTRELQLADVVVCPSRFVAESLRGSVRAEQRVLVAPFGSPEVSAPARGARRTGPLRVLFAGSLTQRKGLADLFAAMRLLGRKDVQLVVLGTPLVGLDFYRRAGGDFVYEPTRPHGAVLELMRSCDVFCLPSIVEGRALVVQEAMSAGLPAIITANTGADDVIESGVNGWIVPVRSPAALAEKLNWFADRREALPEFSAAAAQATRSFTWHRYGATVMAALA